MSDSAEDLSLHPVETESAAPPLPEFTLRNVLGDIVYGIKALFQDPFVNRIMIPIIISLSSIICKGIIAFVPYTEIDFKTYMQQIELVNDGELDYSLIEGDTGPVVYPAGFIQIYQAIHYMTMNGTDIVTAQKLFGYLFSFTVLLICIVYTMTPKLKPWPLYLLLLSKRLYSIYVLRLFNDCFTTICMVAVVLFLQQASYWYKTGGSSVAFWLTVLASDVFSIAISIKMNALLYFPAFALISYFLVGENLFKFLMVILVIPFIQVMVGWKFLLPLFWDDEEASYLRWTYINQAFNFKRKFLYEWTVNWRFLPEETFLSDNFHKLLLAGHLLVLIIFVFTRFLNQKVIGKSLTQLIKEAIFNPFKSTISPTNLFINYDQGPTLILLIMATTNLIGVLFSRSLHYQFLSWYCWSLPFLLYASGINFFISIGIFATHEWCWNTFPSTNASSATLVSLLVIILLSVWANTQFWFGVSNETKKEE